MRKIYGRLDDGIADLIERQAAEKGQTFYSYVSEILTAHAARERDEKSLIEQRLDAIQKDFRTIQYNTELAANFIIQLAVKSVGADAAKEIIARGQELTRANYPDLYPVKKEG